MQRTRAFPKVGHIVGSEPGRSSNNVGVEVGGGAPRIGSAGASKFDAEFWETGATAALLIVSLVGLCLVRSRREKRDEKRTVEVERSLEEGIIVVVEDEVDATKKGS